MERVATIVPTYNRSDWLHGAIESAMKKDWDNSVVIVVDGGSDEEHVDFLRGEDRVTSIFRERGGNIADALNDGIRYAIEEEDADYVEWCSDDDRHHPQKTAIEMKAFRYSPLAKLGLVYSGYDAFWVHGPPEDGNQPYRHVRAIPEYHADRTAQWKAINKLCIINGSTTMIKAEVFKDVGYFDSQWDYAQDFEFWIRIQKRWNVFRVPQVLGSRYEHSTTLTKHVDAHSLNEDSRLFEYVKDWELEEI